MGLFQISVSYLYCTPPESHPNSLTIWGPLPDIRLLPISYATKIPPKLADNMGPPLHSLTCQWPRSKCSLRNFHSRSGSRKRDFQILYSLSARNNKYFTPLLPRCATKLPPSISKKHHSTQLDLQWRSDLTITSGGGGVSQ
jgi:hypothetical protein